RTLTVPASIHSGMGPDCAARVGAMYSEPEAPQAPEAGDGPEQEGLGYTETDLEAQDEMVRQDMYAEVDRDNRAARDRMQAIRDSGRKLTYADVFPEDAG